MGITHVTVNVANLRKDKPSYEADFLVDTGAIDCLAPASSLDAAGIEVEGRNVYELANGEVVEYPFGFARISFMGSETVGQIVFGPEGCEPLLGTVALENTGVGVDPVSRSLRRMPAKPLK
jgi:clan AA aspartic protease